MSVRSAGSHARSNPSDRARRLSAELHELATRFAHHHVTVREVVAELGERASALLCIVLALPMCAPVGIPGLSVPFGLVIFVLTARFALGLPPWLPRRLLALKLPPRFFRALLEGTSKLVGWIERRLRPRWPWFAESPLLVRIHTGVICLGALLLMLPLGGIPFTNTLPALVIVVGLLGLMERDGIGVAAAYALLFATLAYFAIYAKIMVELAHRLAAWLGA